MMLRKSGLCQFSTVPEINKCLNSGLPTTKMSNPSITVKSQHASTDYPVYWRASATDAIACNCTNLAYTDPREKRRVRLWYRLLLDYMSLLNSILLCYTSAVVI